MPGIALSVVVPTRSRPGSVLRLLRDLEGQTLPASEFEVLLVDDGSEPPLELSVSPDRYSFSLKLVRRTEDHGAHESRFAGLREATGRRVLFLDDDLALCPELLAEHAHAEGGFAVGPVLYHPESKKTPFQRFQAGTYAEEVRVLEHKGPQLSTAEWYICNSSAPTGLYLSVFEDVGTAFGNPTMAADGFDEMMFLIHLRDHDGPVRFMSKALVLHMDNKTVAQACRERTIHGKLDCRLMLEFPSARREVRAYHVLVSDLASNKALRDWVFWVAPGFFRLIANLLTAAADHGPAQWMPASICRFPLTVAYWDGVRSVLPSFKSVCALIEPSSVKR